MTKAGEFYRQKIEGNISMWCMETFHILFLSPSACRNSWKDSMARWEVYSSSTILDLPMLPTWVFSSDFNHPKASLQCCFPAFSTSFSTNFDFNRKFLFHGRLFWTTPFLNAKTSAKLTVPLNIQYSWCENFSYLVDFLVKLPLFFMRVISSSNSFNLIFQPNGYLLHTFQK
jgi:hypothetical protein